ncbi:hypothetical protein DN524_33165, partial [Burkholderia multivorans]
MLPRDLVRRAHHLRRRRRHRDQQVRPRTLPEDTGVPSWDALRLESRRSRLAAPLRRSVDRDLFRGLRVRR